MTDFILYLSKDYCLVTLQEKNKQQQQKNSCAILLYYRHTFHMVACFLLPWLTQILYLVFIFLIHQMDKLCCKVLFRLRFYASLSSISSFGTYVVPSVTKGNVTIPILETKSQKHRKAKLCPRKVNRGRIMTQVLHVKLVKTQCGVGKRQWSLVSNILGLKFDLGSHISCSVSYWQNCE